MRLTRTNRVVLAWLTRAGIGARSEKMAELLALNLDPHVVTAHVLDFLAFLRGIEDAPPRHSCGLLIKMLADGDPPPPLRCRTCLRRKNASGSCYCEVEAVVER